MPRFSEDGGLGVRVPGLYESLLMRERRRCAERDPRNMMSDNPADPSPVYRRSRRLLDALEGGKPVVMVRWMVGTQRSTPPVVLPWDRELVTAVEVSPDDVVRPAQDCGHWPGCEAEEHVTQMRRST